VHLLGKLVLCTVHHELVGPWRWVPNWSGFFVSIAFISVAPAWSGSPSLGVCQVCGFVQGFRLGLSTVLQQPCLVISGVYEV
jgi:hypothetical protein